METGIVVSAGVAAMLQQDIDLAAAARKAEDDFWFAHFCAALARAESEHHASA